MTIRAATDQDIPLIVELLKVSLGESLMPKSEAFWRWKHVDNPFGPSPVLLAFENDMLIGVRAFMRWEWKQGNKIYKAVRAVDTATHPAHQGKGIFKKLTLQLLDQCKAEGVDFIFNTPNTSSKPGYLKMGWEQAGKLKVFLRPAFNFRKRAANFDSLYSVRHVKSVFANSVNMITNSKAGYMEWRYKDNPNVTYYAAQDQHATDYLILFRLKPYAAGVEFRICDWYLNNETATKKMKAHLRQAVCDSGANLMSWGGSGFPLTGFGLSIGPDVTVRPLTAARNYLSFDSWKPTLGDMEVF